MEITEKDLSKLKQLDRIEFRQKYDRIIYPENISFYLIKCLAVGIIILLSLAFMSIGFGYEELATSISMSAYTLLKFIFILLFTIPFDIYRTYLYNKQKDELKEEYFEEVTIKKK